MPKIQFVDPVEMRKPGKITFQDIPINQYNKTIERKKQFSAEDFKNSAGHGLHSGI